MKIKQNPLQILLVLFIASISLAATCDSSKEMSANSTCNTEAIIKDFTGLDGCSLLIVLNNGDKLLPADITDESFDMDHFVDGQKIRFAYTTVEGGMSVCMAEKAIINITCIEVVQ